MEIVIILYLIGIVIYWLGILNFLHATKRNWNDVDESLKVNTKKRSKVSCSLALIMWSIIPMVNFLIGFLYISNPFYFLKK